MTDKVLFPVQKQEYLIVLAAEVVKAKMNILDKNVNFLNAK